MRECTTVVCGMGEVGRCSASVRRASATQTHARTHTHTHTCTHTHTHTHRGTHTHTHARTHTHTLFPPRARLSRVQWQIPTLLPVPEHAHESTHESEHRGLATHTHTHACLTDAFWLLAGEGHKVAQISATPTRNERGLAGVSSSVPRERSDVGRSRDTAQHLGRRAAGPRLAWSLAFPYLYSARLGSKLLRRGGDAHASRAGPAGRGCCERRSRSRARGSRMPHVPDEATHRPEEPLLQALQTKTSMTSTTSTSARASSTSGSSC